MRAAFALAVAPLLLLGACGSEDCTTIGATSEVQFDAPTGWTFAKVCLNTDCLTDQGAQVSIPALTDKARDYQYKYTVVDADGVSHDGRGNLVTQQFRINGKGCGPVTANAIVTIGEDATSTVGYPDWAEA